MDLDLIVVRSFVVLAAEGDQRRAASRLGITPSALSKRVHRLETQLGIAVTTRTAHGVALTAAGERFLPHARDLVDHAARARAAARGARLPEAIRIGVPAGSGVRFLEGVGMRDVENSLTRRMPGVQLRYVHVPFTALRNCLPERHVDLLWTNSPVRHPAVETRALPLTTARIGVVGAGHSLAEAAEITVEEFAGAPILYNPHAPEEWMAPFWLGDVRGRREARLIGVDARHTDAVNELAGSGAGVLVVGAMSQVDLPTSSRSLKLIGAKPITFHIAKRAADRRSIIRTIIELLSSRPAADLS